MPSGTPCERQKRLNVVMINFYGEQVVGQSCWVDKGRRYIDRAGGVPRRALVCFLVRVKMS